MSYADVGSGIRRFRDPPRFLLGGSDPVCDPSAAIDLAIVIPAFKPDFLGEALESVAAQTDRRFRLYVGDDAGPGDVRRICDARRVAFGALIYHRFGDNLGRSSLPAQWNRCVALTAEPWVWLFSDDDVMTPDAVAAFHSAAVGAEDVDVVRFNSEVIDARGRRIAINPRHPGHESGAEFIFDRLRGRRTGYVVDYVFRRSAFDAAGGFPDYPLAWGADYAAWFLFSRRGGIRTLPGGGVQYRESDRSISGTLRGYRREKFDATLRFLRFVEQEVAPADPRGWGRDEWRRVTENWFLGQVHSLLPVGPSLSGWMFRASRHWWRAGAFVRLAQLSLWNIRAWIRQALTRYTPFARIPERGNRRGDRE
ncbi:MAG TPA: glycosyltransferase family A protein [Longimicrobiales bacterium]|nr:glycosyltransferase family A protein [Longimicrobiales bacterium]